MTSRCRYATHRKELEVTVALRCYCKESAFATDLREGMVDGKREVNSRAIGNKEERHSKDPYYDIFKEKEDPIASESMDLNNRTHLSQ